MQLIDRAYRYRFYPTEEQKTRLAQTFGCCRWVYNHFLELKGSMWRKEKKALTYGDSSRVLTSLKDEYPWLREVSSVTIQQTLRHLDRAFSNFFSYKAQYPSFKKRHYQQSASYTKSAFTYKNGKIKLAKQKKSLKIRWSRSFHGEPTSLTVTKDSSGRYYISIIVKEEVQPLPFTKNESGFDLGITNTVIDDEGNQISNPNFLKKEIKILRRRQKSISRKRKGSKNRQKQRIKVARLHSRIRDKRHDFLHKLSSQIVNENQVIAVESLQVKNMIKNKHLSRAIADVSWGTFLRFLEYKCHWYGKEFIQIDQFFPSSKRCSHCGHTLLELPLSIRQWECPDCNTLHDRDTNAAKNILKEGLRLLGETIEKVPWGARDLKPVESV